jgi:hypothetical protein
VGIFVPAVEIEGDGRKSKMNRARLVKRDEAMKREEARQLRLQPGSSLGHSGETVKAWISGRQSTPRPSPREIFAALFVPQQAG